MFEGQPTALNAEASLDISPQLTAPPEIDVGGTRYPLLLRFAGDGSASLSFTLPSTTPPGRLEATVHVAERMYPALIDVRERQGVHFEPRSLEAEGTPGAEIVAEVQVKNVGNVPLALETEQSLALRESGALARGIKKAFKETSGDLVSRLIVLGERLGAESVRQVAVVYRAGFSVLGVGETGSVEIHVRVPEDLASPKSWTGMLPILGADVSITLEISSRLQRRGTGRSSTQKGAES